jgi:hypothetical protein
MIKVYYEALVINYLIFFDSCNENFQNLIYSLSY